MTLARSTSDRPKTSPTDGQHLSMARRNRAEIVVADEVGVYHCVQRVVRRAFLCGVDPVSGNSYDHRRAWIRDRLEYLAGLFGVEVAAFAVMSNHVHVILRNRPDMVALWTDQEVALRWLTIFPGRVCTKPDPAPASALAAFSAPTAEQARSLSPGTPALPPAGEPTDSLEQAVALLSADPALVATLRGRLSSLSWFMRALAEPIARRANREDHCSGRFWEGRFKSQRLLDEAALLACSVYVDLNPIRAGLADRPETSELTSAHERIMVLLQDIPAKPDTAAVDTGPMAAAPADPSATALVEEDSPVLAEESPAALTGSGNVEPARQDTADVPLRRDGWLSPIELDERAEPLTTAMAAPQTPAAAAKRFGSSRSRRASDRGLLPMTLESYLSLLDWTGRQLRAGTSGVIPPGLASILDRLQVSAESWLETVARFGRRFHRAVGLADHLQAEAQRLGVAWLHGLRWSQAAFAPPLRS
ncbi:MAG: transposase [Isosphaeraceae bacterium]